MFGVNKFGNHLFREVTKLYKSCASPAPRCPRSKYVRCLLENVTDIVVVHSNCGGLESQEVQRWRHILHADPFSNLWGFAFDSNHDSL